MRRAFDIDVLACPRCGGCIRVIATIDDAKTIDEILAGVARDGTPVGGYTEFWRLDKSGALDERLAA